MATPMTHTKLLDQLEKWHVPYKGYRDWEVHHRPASTGAWGPVNGFMVHHTGSDSTDQRELLYNGRSDLPGPLCHFGIAQDGTVWLIGWGRANHAGKGDPDVLKAVINEDYGSYPPTDNEATVDGNVHFYGVEIWYSGSHIMTREQYDSLLLLGAAICDGHNWTSKSVIGHGEWQPGKWDPGYSSGKMMDMADVRTDIQDTLKGGTVVTNPTPDIFEEVWKTDAVKPPKGRETETNPLWTPETMARFAAEQSELANKKLDKIIAALKTLGVSL
jgi:hypothetical protein